MFLLGFGFPIFMSLEKSPPIRNNRIKIFHLSIQIYSEHPASLRAISIFETTTKRGAKLVLELGFEEIAVEENWEFLFCVYSIFYFPQILSFFFLV